MDYDESEDKKTVETTRQYKTYYAIRPDDRTIIRPGQLTLSTMDNGIHPVCQSVYTRRVRITKED